MVTVSFDPSHLPVNMFDLVYEKWSLRRLLWDVWCWRSEHVVVQALWLWGLHHYLAPHPIISPSDNFKECAKHHLPQNPWSFPPVLSVRLPVRYSGFLEKKSLWYCCTAQIFFSISDCFSLPCIDLQFCSASTFSSVRPSTVLHLLSIIHHAPLLLSGYYFQITSFCCFAVYDTMMKQT